MRARLALLAALALCVPAAAPAGSGSARLLVTAKVVRSLEVRVSGEPAAAAVSVRTTGAAGWDAPLSGLGASVSPYAPDPRWVVVTVLADASPPGASGARGP